MTNVPPRVRKPAAFAPPSVLRGIYGFQMALTVHQRTDHRWHVQVVDQSRAFGRVYEVRGRCLPALMFRVARKAATWAREHYAG